MKFLIQRVTEAKVRVDSEVIGQIQKGFLVFIGVSQNDTQEIADKMVHKLLNLRIFEDAEGKTNLIIIKGSLRFFSIYISSESSIMVKGPSLIREIFMSGGVTFTVI